MKRGCGDEYDPPLTIDIGDETVKKSPGIGRTPMPSPPLPVNGHRAGQNLRFQLTHRRWMGNHWDRPLRP